MLASVPWATSGLAGVQLAATSMLAELRQLCLPATTTAVPTNLGNQDVVPMSLNGAIKAREQLRLAELIIASNGLAVAQCDLQEGSPGLWGTLRRATKPLEADRALHGEVRTVSELLKHESFEACARTFSESHE